MMLRAFWSVILPAALLAGSVHDAHAETITVSAAISLKEALNQIASQYQRQTGDQVNINFGASGALATQVEQGAPVDVFISAAAKQVDQLIKSARADAASRQVVVTNTLVLIAPSAAKSTIKSFPDLAQAPVQKLALGEPRAVPAGHYAMQTLESLHLAEALKPRMVFASNVRQVLDYVQQGEVDAGIVYSTDVRQAADAVKVIAVAPASLHDPIEYPAVIISGTAHHTAAARFIDYLLAAPAQAIFIADGFLPPAPQPTTNPARD